MEERSVIERYKLDENKMYEVQVDDENGACDWWDFGCREEWNFFVGERKNSCKILGSLLADLIGQSEMITGWNTGTNYELHPFVWSECD